MKIKALFLFLLLSLSGQVLASPLPPLWDEFCSSQYCFVQEPVKSSRFKTVGKYMLWGIVLGPFGLMIPVIQEDKKKADISYWENRHRQFDREVATCNEAEGDKSTCYMQIRMIESQKTQAREMHIDNSRLRSAVYSRR